MRKLKGCNPIGCGIQTISCGGCFFLLVILLIIVIFLLQDRNNLNIVKQLLYIEYKFNNEVVPTINDVQNEINNQISDIGINNIKIKDYHLERFIIERFNIENVNVVFRNQSILIDISIDQYLSKHMLISLSLHKYMENDFYISEIKILNITLPEFITKLILDNLNYLSANSSIEVTNNSIFKLIFPEIKNLKINSINIEEQSLNIEAEFSPSLF
jgi:hypothetical protein